jgi:hypothetical protein
MIEFITAHDIDHPFQRVVEEELVKCMEDVDSKKESRICLTPVPPKWLMYSIQSKCPAYIDKLRKFSRITSP